MQIIASSLNNHNFYPLGAVMEKELLRKRAVFIKMDILQTAMSLDFIAEQMAIRDKDNHEWMEDLCCAMIKDRAQHLRERAEELFLELNIEEENIHEAEAI
jgi:hypothetical protein